MSKESSLKRKVAPETDLSIDLHESELFLHYLHLSASMETETGDEDSFMQHYHNFEKVELGLKSGFLDYEDARPYLTDIINCEDNLNVFTIYFSWFGLLTNYRNHGEVRSDAEKLKQATEKTLRLMEDSASQAEYFGYYINSAGSFLTSGEINTLFSEQVESVEKLLPPGSEITSGAVGSLMSFLRACRKNGYLETDTISEYLIKLARNADPKIIDGFTTFRLIQFLSDEELVSRWVCEEFVERILESLPNIEHGVLNKEIIIEGLIPMYLELGKVQEAYDLLSKIKESTSYLHAVGSLLKDGSRNLSRIDHLFYTSYLSLVADSVGSKVEDLSEKFIKAQRRMWVFHKFLRARSMAKYDKDFILFDDEEILSGIKEGTLPTAKLAQIAELVDPEKPESLILIEPILIRVRKIFVYRQFDTKTEDVLDAIAALIVLKNKRVPRRGVEPPRP
jgi:hypothetical protein